MSKVEEWFTLDEIEKIDSKDSRSNEKLYCIAVDSPTKQFQIGKMGVPTHNTEEGKAEDELKGEATMIIGSILRLGRAAGVHMVLATQRPDAKILPGEAKANLGVRINCGYTDSTASSMILGSGDGTRVKASPRGRLFLRIYSKGNHGQGFFATQDWIDEYLESQGLNPDGTPISGRKRRVIAQQDLSSFENSDLDTATGVDNTSKIEQMREEDEDAFTNQMDEYISQLDESFSESEQTGQDDNDKMGRPELFNRVDDSKFHRPEDDYDKELEDLINENFEN